MIRVVDLFTGAGGLTFGFTKQIRNNRFVDRGGFDIVFANEIDIDAANSFRANYPSIPMLNTDVRNVDEKYLENTQIDVSNIDAIIGGPPCQSYSTIGARKNDDRAKLYTEYLRLLKMLKPKLFIFENVTGLLSMKYGETGKILDRIIKEFDDAGYRVSYKTLDTVHYAIPQTRRRVFIVGVSKEIKSRFVLGQAIGDLPVISDVSDPEQRVMLLTKYQRLMKSIGTTDALSSEHIASKHGERITRIIKSLAQGESKAHINEKVLKNELPMELYLTSGYYNSYGRLWWDRPCVTLTSNFNRPSSFRCVHPLEDRALSTREGARIQSFPDSYVFIGSRTSKNSQIGNAVPPVLSVYLADSIHEFINNTKGDTLIG